METKELTFTKAQICSAGKYKSHIDIVSALLEDDKTYTFEQVDKIIDKFLKGRVK